VQTAWLTSEPPRILFAFLRTLGGTLATIPLAAAQVLYLFAPLLVSAALAGVVMRRRWLARLDRPLDHGATLGGRRCLGDGKTWRGLLLSVTGACFTVVIQRAVAPVLPGIWQVVDYASVNPLALGGALGVGAVLGELPNSFVKRRLGIARGETTSGPLGVLFYVWDQIDTVTGAWPLLGLWLRPSALLVTMSVVVALVVHPVIAWIGYRLGARDTPR
jgi:CDP-2,3-bis-(O-geranylgeranyl)-sn-glycerol synthase